MIPKYVYEVLPFLYILAGTASVMGLDISTGKISGLLLMSAGVVVYWLRLSYRRELRKRYWAGY
jgi:hypothetical protein